MDTETSPSTLQASSWTEIEPLMRQSADSPPEERIELGRRAVQIAQSEFASPDLRIVQAYEFLANAALQAEETSQAEEALREGIVICNEILPTDLQVTARLVGAYGKLCESASRNKEAVAYYKQVVPMLEKMHGKDHLSLAEYFHRLADLSKDLGDSAAARQYFEAFVSCHEHSRGKDHQLTMDALNDYGVFLIGLSDYEHSVRIHQGVLECREHQFGSNHPDVAQSLGNLAAAYHLLGDYQQAGDYYDQALTIYEKYPDVASQDFITVSRNFADLLMQVGRTDHAREINAQVDAFEEYLNR